VGITYAHQTAGTLGDFDLCWVAARALLERRDPYAAVVTAGWPWPMYYPMPAVLLALPFALLPMPVARAVFAGLGSGLLVYGLSRRGWWAVWVLASGAFLHALWTVQWSPLLTAAVLLPTLGGVLAAKPNIGAALWIGYPSRIAALGALALVALGFLLLPGWPRSWLAAVELASHLRPLVLRPGGVLLLLALARWRRPEARLLVALACVPQSGLPYETVPLFVVPRNRREMLLLGLLTHVALGVIAWIIHAESYAETLTRSWPWMLGLVYLPVLLVVLRRPNVRDGIG
jgi:hypothetical protein